MRAGIAQCVSKRRLPAVVCGELTAGETRDHRLPLDYDRELVPVSWTSDSCDADGPGLIVCGTRQLSITATW